MDWTSAIAVDLADAASPEDAETAFAVFVEKHREKVYRVARQMMPSHEAADDVVQEAFLRAFKSLRGFRRHSSVDTWLYRIVMNVALNQLRRERRLGRLLDRIRRDPRSARPRNPHSVVESEELRERVQAAVGSLPPDQRAVIVLFDLEGLSCADVSDALNIPEGTVRSRLYHARRRLRARLEPYVLGSSPERA